MTTFNKLLAIKEGGGNPGAPGSSDDFNLAFGNFDAELSSFDLTASNNLLVAFDAASLDFGNAGANPDFNFLGDGDFTVAGYTHLTKVAGGNTDDFVVEGRSWLKGYVATGDLSVTGNLHVSGQTGISYLDGGVEVGTANGGGNLQVYNTSTLAGDVSMGANLTVTGSASIAGNLSVAGTIYSVNSEAVLVKDRFIELNADYTTVNSPLDAGLTFNIEPLASATITAMDSQANTITLAGGSGIQLAAGDLFVVGAGLAAQDLENAGLYEVASFANDVITISIQPGVSFVKNAIPSTLANLNVAGAHVTLGVLRTSSAGALQWATGFSAPMTYGDVPFDGYTGSQSWTADLSLSGDLIIANANSSNALALGDAAADPAVDASFGKLYAKSMPTGQNNISELFYISEIGGVDTAIQITKDGALNISEIVSLQIAYNTAGSIVTNSQNGAVSISAGANLTDALDVTGNMTVSSANADLLTVDTVTPLVKVGTDLVVVDANLNNVFSVASADGDVTTAGTLTVLLGADLQSTLDVGGNATFSGDVSINDAQATPKFTVASATGNTVISGTLYNYGNITSEGDIAVLNQNAATTFSVSAATGNTAIAGMLDVDGASTFEGNIGVWTNGGQTQTLSIDAATGNTDIAGTLDVGAAATFDSTVTAKGDLSVVDANLASVFSVAAASGNTDIKGTLTVAGDISLTNAQAVEVFSVDAATGNATLAGDLDVDGAINVGLVATFEKTGGSAQTPDLSVAGYAQFAGTLDLDGSVDADVSAFDLLSSGDVSIKASGILSLKGPAVAANLAETAGANIALGDLVMMTANGLAPAQANAQNVIALGAALAAINANTSSEGLVADFGSVEIKAEQNLNTAIAAGQRLYLSAATAGAVTNAEPASAGSSVFQVGVALAGDVNGKVKVALRPQFMYNVF